MAVLAKGKAGKLCSPRRSTAVQLLYRVSHSLLLPLPAPLTHATATQQMFSYAALLLSLPAPSFPHIFLSRANEVLRGAQPPDQNP